MRKILFLDNIHIILLPVKACTIVYTILIMLRFHSFSMLYILYVCLIQIHLYQGTIALICSTPCGKFHSVLIMYKVKNEKYIIQVIKGGNLWHSCQKTI